MSSQSDTYRVLTHATRIGLLMIGGTLLVLAPSGERWRLWVLGLTTLPLLIPEVSRWRGAELPWPGLAAVVVVGQFVLITVTGGIHSPLILIVVPFAVLAGYAVGRRSLPLVGVFVLLLLGLLGFDISPWCPPDFVPAAFGGHRPLVGRLVWVTVLIVVIVAGNRLSRIARAALLGEQQRVIEAQQAAIAATDRSRADLVALSGALAHALKNPLTAVMSLASYRLRRAQPGTEQAGELRIMVSEMERMRSSLADLLNLSRRPDPLELAAIDLARPVAEVLTAHRALAEDAGMTLEGPLGAARARVDRRKVEQVLTNLVQNAVQAGHPGGRVEVHLAMRGDHAVVEVHDDGAGLPPALADRVFEPGVTGRREGTGIGLTICRTLVEQHGGHIRIESAGPAGAGTRVVFTVRRDGPPAAPADGRSS